MTRITPSQVEVLLSAARQARGHAYAPYSGFMVGAAALGASGGIYGGCNVENSSYGLTLCAERIALGAAVCAGERQLLALGIYTESGRPTPPCGACRQVLAELGMDSLVIAANLTEQRTWRLRELLPEAFSRQDFADGPGNHSGGQADYNAHGRERAT